MLAFTLYPRELKRVAGLDGITAADITQVQLSLSVYREPESSGMAPRAEPIAQNEIITDEVFFEELLNLLDKHTLRRRLTPQRVEYRRVDPTKPSLVLLSLSLASEDTLFLAISHDSRYIALWSADSPYTRYRLYGEGLDTRRLVESYLRLNPTHSD